MKADIIITGKGHAGTQATLQEDFTCHKLFEAADKTAFLKELSTKVRGLATFGPMPVDGKLMDALPKLEIISNFGVGVDAINLDDAKKRNIIVTSASCRNRRPTRAPETGRARALIRSLRRLAARRSASSASGASARRSRSARSRWA